MPICPLLSIGQDKPADCTFKCAWYRVQSKGCAFITMSEYIGPLLKEIWKKSKVCDELSSRNDLNGTNN